MGNRRNVRAALSSFLTGAAGIVAVFQDIPIENYSGEFPVAMITLPVSKEYRSASGKKRIDYEPSIQIWSIDYSGDSVTAALNFDDILDNIDAQFRTDPTLGGAVLAAGIDFIDTDQVDPVIDEHGVILSAIKRLDVTIEFTNVP